MSGDSVGPFCSLLTVGAVGFIGLLVSDSFGISAYFDAYSQSIHSLPCPFFRSFVSSFVRQRRQRTDGVWHRTDRSGPKWAVSEPK